MDNNKDNNCNGNEDTKDSEPQDELPNAVDVLAGLWTSNEGNMSLNYDSRVRRLPRSASYRPYTTTRGLGQRPAFRTFARRNTADVELHLSSEQHLKVLQKKFAQICQSETPVQLENFLLRYPRFDTHFGDETAFVRACMDNSKDMVEYLYNRLQPDITAGRDEAFRFACLSNRIENARFLESICPRYGFKLRFRVVTDTVRVSDLEVYRDYVINHDTIQIDKGDEKPPPHVIDELHEFDDDDDSDDFEYEFEDDDCEDCEDCED